MSRTIIKGQTVYGVPSIVTNGLVLYLDAANTKSYPTTGTTWTDLSGNSNNGVLTNGPTFDSSNGGSIVFDGVNDNVLITNAFNLQNQNLTVSLWIYITNIPNSISTLIDFSHGTVPNPQGWVIQTENGTTGRNFYFAYYSTSSFQPASGIGSGIGVPLTLNTWQNIVFTKNNTTVIGYKNGVAVFNPSLAASSTITYINGRNNLMIDGAIGFTRYIGGKYSVCQIYNKALSATEVLQNYNALKSRFGL